MALTLSAKIDAEVLPSAKKVIYGIISLICARCSQRPNKTRQVLINFISPTDGMEADSRNIAFYCTQSRRICSLKFPRRVQLLQELSYCSDGRAMLHKSNSEKVGVGQFSGVVLGIVFE